MTESRKLRVFLCHASQDKPIVRELYQRLLAEGWIDPWLDEEKLLPGQDWNVEIEEAVEASDAVIVCLSNNSVTKEGYVQKELRKVLDVADEKPEGTIFIIPLRLEECDPSQRLQSRHYIDYFPLEKRNKGFKGLLLSLQKRLEIIGLFGAEGESLPVSLLEIGVPGYSSIGNYEEVIERYEEAIKKALKIGDSPEHIAFMCQDLSGYLEIQGQIQKAHQYIDLGLQILSNNPENSLTRLWLDARLGRLLSHEKGKGWKTVELLKSVIEKGENLPPSQGREILLYETLNYLGLVLNSVGAYDEGHNALRRSAAIALKVGNSQEARTALMNLAYNIIDHGKFQEALQIAEDCLQEGLDKGLFEDQSYSYTIMGAAYVGLENYQAAITALKMGISLFEDLKQTWNDPYSYYDLARAYLGVGDANAAYDAAKKSLLSAEKGSDDFDAYEQAFGYEVLGRSLAELGDWSKAEEDFKKAIKIMHDEGSLFEKARAQKFYGLALIKKGETEKGIKLIKTSLSMMKRLKMAYEANAIRDTLSGIKE